MSAEQSQVPTSDELPDIAPIIVDLAAPGVFDGQVTLARMIQRFVAAMPLEALVAMADDRVQMAIVRAAPADEIAKARREKATFVGLLETQRHGKFVRARYGE